MKIITLHQPWATLIALGLKEYETRHWPTAYRGDVLIHAAKRRPDGKIFNEVLQLTDKQDMRSLKLYQM